FDAPAFEQAKVLFEPGQGAFGLPPVGCPDRLFELLVAEAEADFEVTGCRMFFEPCHGVVLRKSYAWPWPRTSDATPTRPQYWPPFAPQPRWGKKKGAMAICHNPLYFNVLW